MGRNPAVPAIRQRPRFRIAVVSGKRFLMAPTANPNTVLLLSTVLMSVAQSYGASVMLEPMNRPALFWRYPNVFLALGVMPGIAALAVFAWSFVHLPWWEPILTAALGVALIGPLVAFALKVLGDSMYTIAYLLSPVAAVFVATWALGLI